MPRGRSTTSRTPWPAGCSRATSRSSAVIVHDITDPYFAEVVRGVEDAASAAASSSSPAARSAIAERERSYVRLLRSMRAADVIFAGSGLDDPALNDGDGRAPGGDAGDGAAVVHLSPHALGEAGDRRRQRRGHRRDGRGAGRAGAPPDRVPRRADVAVRRAPAAGGLPARAWPRPGSRSTSGSS